MCAQKHLGTIFQFFIFSLNLTILNFPTIYKIFMAVFHLLWVLAMHDNIFYKIFNDQMHFGTMIKSFINWDDMKSILLLIPQQIALGKGEVNHLEAHSAHPGPAKPGSHYPSPRGGDRHRSGPRGFEC